MKLIKLLALTTLFVVTTVEASELPHKSENTEAQPSLTKAERAQHFALGLGKAAIVATAVYMPKQLLVSFGFLRYSKIEGTNDYKANWSSEPKRMMSNFQYAVMILATLRSLWGAKSAAHSALESFRKAFN